MMMQSLNIFSLLGIIMLIGLVAKNAILLVDFTNQLKAEGAKTIDALLEAGRTRLRPILMTTIAMVIGMLPLALASGAGAEWKNGMAWALIGGLTSSMLLTLVVVPVMYLIIDTIKDRFSSKKTVPDETPKLLPAAIGV
jgi:hydrophobic/amphiphilic exporter-1 (mainly G- bacteria), HAE1 family